ncbi:MAG: transposase [Saprospiraceae bacterium]|nr:transposase [Saprospiraceae bacterium]
MLFQNPWNPQKLKICSLILFYISIDSESDYLYSVDEKTGIQAKEFKELIPQKEGDIKKMEFEYTRHGTTCLTAALNVSTGKIDHYIMEQTRTEEDFVKTLSYANQGQKKSPTPIGYSVGNKVKKEF